MHLNQLKTFLILSECLNVTETSSKLFCTQPSVSIKIKKLEEELGAILFERIGNRLYLTDKGKIFRQYANNIINTLDIARDHLHQYDNPNYGKFRFGASHFVGVYLLPQALAAFKQLFPNVEVGMDILPSKLLIQRFEEHEFEFLILSDNIPFDEKYYIRKLFYLDKLTLVCSPKNSLSKRKSCSLLDLKNEVFITKPSNSETRVFLLKKMDRNIIKDLKFMEVNSLEGIKQCIIYNLGISIVSRLAVENEINNGILSEVEIKDINLERGINYIFHKDKILTPAIKLFLNKLNEMKNW